MIWATVSTWSFFSLTVSSFTIFGYKEYNQSDFSIDHLVMSMCRFIFCVARRGCLLWPVHCLVNSVSLFPASFCTPRPNLPVTPGIPWIYFSLPLYSHKGFNLVIPEWSNGFPFFLQFKSEFCKKELMIWATVRPRFSFCWLYRASPSSAAKNIIRLISVVTI